MGTKSCTKMLNFSTRFSCENLAVEDFVIIFMGKNLVDGEMCLKKNQSAPRSSEHPPVVRGKKCQNV